jgi:hypothetical protein
MDPSGVENFDEVIPIATPDCDGCGPAKDLIYIQSLTALMLMKVTPALGRSFVYHVRMPHGVYRFKEFRGSEYVVKLRADAQEGRVLKSSPLCCGSKVILELGINTSFEEIVQMVADLENESTFYRPNGITFRTGEDGELNFVQLPYVTPRTVLTNLEE